MRTNGKSTDRGHTRGQRVESGDDEVTHRLSLPGSAEVADAITLLELEHRKIEALFAAYADTGPRDFERKWQIVAALRQMLGVHMTIEEEVLYAAVRAGGTRAVAQEIAEAVQQHHLVDVLLAELAGCSPAREEFDAKVAVLDETVAHHVQEEETVFFVQARALLIGRRLVELGASLADRRAELTGQAEKVESPSRAGPIRWVSRDFD
jgi:hypothetical protein